MTDPNLSARAQVVQMYLHELPNVLSRRQTYLAYKGSP